MTRRQASAGEEPGHAPADKLLGKTGVKLRLAVASGLVLAAGALLAPRVVPTPLSVPQERAAPLLEEQIPAATPAVSFRGVQDAVARGRNYAVAIPAPPMASINLRNDYSTSGPRATGGGFGVFVSSIYVLTHADALDGRSSLTLTVADGQSIPATVAAYEPSTGLVLLQTATADRVLPTLAAAAPETGALAAGIAHTGGRDIAVPLFVTSVTRDRFFVSGVQTAAAPGLPIYTLDGDLIAIAAGDGPTGTAYPAADAATRLMARAAAGDRRASLGLSLQDLTGPLVGAFGNSGVLVTDVVPGGPADQIDVTPGDVLQAIGDVEVSSVGAAAEALAALRTGAETPLRLARGGQVRTVNAVAALAYEVAALARAGQEHAVPAGIDARAIFPAEVIEAAGIPPNARVLRVNARAISSRAEALREWRRGRGAAALLLRHGDRQFFAVIEGRR